MLCLGRRSSFQAGVERVGNIVQALRIIGHSGVPVVDEPPLSEAPELVRLVLRSPPAGLAERQGLHEREGEDQR
jgi:hypothetical protein